MVIKGNDECDECEFDLDVCETIFAFDLSFIILSVTNNNNLQSHNILLFPASLFPASHYLSLSQKRNFHFWYHL